MGNRLSDMSLHAEFDQKGYPSAGRYSIKFAFIVSLLILAVLAILWLRTGIYPAASTGDEVFTSESGYWLLHDGVLKRPWMADAYGGAEHDFYPPILRIITAGLFYLFGLNAFAMMAPTSLAATLLIAAMFAWTRTRKIPIAWALVACLAVFGLTPFLYVIVRSRYEPWVAVFLVAGCAAASVSAEAAQHRFELIRSACAGSCIALACITYYPDALFALAAGLIGVIPLLSRKITNIGAFLLGGALPSIPWLIFFVSHFEQFDAQFVAAGGHYFSFKNVFAWIVLNPHQPMQFIGTLEIIGSLLIALYWTFLAAGELRRIGVQILILGMLLFIYGRQFSAVIFLPFLMIGLSCIASTPMNPVKFNTVSWRLKLRASWPRIVMLTLAVAACVQVSVMGVIAYADRTARNYDNFAHDLLKLVDIKQRFAVDQRAWLALRANVPADSMHLLISCGNPEGSALTSTELKTTVAPLRFDFLLLRPDIEYSHDLDCYPALI